MKKCWSWGLALALALTCLLLPTLAEEAAGTDRILVAQGERLTLYLSADLCGVEVEDALTGQVWSSSLNDPTAANLKINAAWQKRMSSLVTVNYTNLQSGLGVVNNMPLLTDKQMTASYQLIDNGVRVEYDMGASEISLAVEIWLDGDTLVARIPWDSIREYGKFSVTSIDLLPFFFSATDAAEGYFLYPDGCGAVMEFQDNAHLGEKAVLYTVYGDYARQESLLEMFDETAPAVMMPVFGMSRGGHGLLTVIEDGVEASRISLNSSSKIVGVNYLFASCVYRRSFSDVRVTTRSISVFDTNAIEMDHQVRILFMEQENPTYSDMAVTWRDYLLSTGAAQRNARENQALIDLFMSAPERGLLFDTLRTVTTLSEAEEILVALDAAGVQNIRASIKGWSRDGYGKTPDRFPLSGAVGNDQALKSLLTTAHGLGATVSLTANVLEANSTQRTYSKRNDVVYTGNHTVLTNKDETVMLLSADVAKEKLDDLLKKAAAFDLDGIRLERIGQALGYNYWNRRYLTSHQTLGIYLDMLSDIRSGLGEAEAEGGNICLLNGVSLMTDVPYEGHGYQVTSYDVPFFQVALHGLVNYAATPGNLSSDLNREMLRWVELGYQPYFELTCHNTEDLIYTSYNSLFSSEYTVWQEEVARATAQFTSGPLAALSDKVIIAHDRLNGTLVRVTYENGTRVYVNYAQVEEEADGLTIPAMGWAVSE